MTAPTRAEDLDNGRAIQFGLLDEWIDVESVSLESGRIVVEGVRYPDRTEDRGYVLMSVPQGFMFLAKPKASQDLHVL